MGNLLRDVCIIFSEVPRTSINNPNRMLIPTHKHKDLLLHSLISNNPNHNTNSKFKFSNRLNNHKSNNHNYNNHNYSNHFITLKTSLSINPSTNNLLLINYFNSIHPVNRINYNKIIITTKSDKVITNNRIKIMVDGENDFQNLYLPICYFL